MTVAPAPLVPAAADLRSFDWFPFFHKRLRGSSFWKRASDLACRISVDLWAEAYEQVPAASLPDDDHLLAEWAGFGRRDISGWVAVKDEVMSAWVRCSDGRWYHPTLSEIACAGFLKQRLHAWQRECDRLRKENARREKAGEDPLEMPPKPSDDPFDEERSGGDAALSERRPAEETQIPAENALRRRRRERYKDTRAGALREEEVSQPREPKPKVARKHPYPPDAFVQWYDSYPHKVGRAAAERAFAKVQRADSVGFETLVTGVANYQKTKSPDREWCNPATWLNQARWADEPATALTNGVTSNRGNDGPRVDFGGGVTWPEASVRSQLAHWRRDPSTWPADRLGPPPGALGCKIPDHLLRDAA